MDYFDLLCGYILKMIRFGGKNLLISAPKQALKAFSVGSPKVHILLIF